MKEIVKVSEQFPFFNDKERDELLSIVNSDEIVFLEGESGAGKSYLAQAIYEDSWRSDRRYNTVSLAALPSALFESELFGNVRGSFTGAMGREGLIEYTDRGTLVLEDITELEIKNQAKFLQFLDEKKVRRLGDNSLKNIDVRIIVTTNRDIEECVKKGTFREDLYYRLISGFRFKIRPIRQLSSPEIGAVLETMIFNAKEKKRKLIGDENMTSGEFTLNNAAVDHVQKRVKGNFRGLYRLANYLSLKDKHVFTENDLPDYVHKSPVAIEGTLAEAAQKHALATFKECKGNQSLAAKRLDISRNTLRKYMKES